MLQSLHDDSSDEEEEIDTPTEEIPAFFAEKLRIDKSTFDPLQWWKENEKRYPALAQEARRVLSMPGTSASSESVLHSQQSGYLPESLPISRERRCSGIPPQEHKLPVAVRGITRHCGQARGTAQRSPRLACIVT